MLIGHLRIPLERGRLNRAFERAFARLRDAYAGALDAALAAGPRFAAVFMAASALTERAARMMAKKLGAMATRGVDLRVAAVGVVVAQGALH